MNSLTCQTLIQEIQTSFHNCHELISWKKQLDIEIELSDKSVQLQNHLRKRYRYRKYKFYKKTFNYLLPSGKNYNNVVFCLCKILDIYHGKFQKLDELNYLYHNMVQYENTWV